MPELPMLCGRAGALSPASATTRAKMWCASVRRMMKATGMLSSASRPLPGCAASASTSSASVKPAPRRKSTAARWRPTFLWKAALVFFTVRFLTSSGAAMMASKSLKTVCTASCRAAESGMATMRCAAPCKRVTSGRPSGGSYDTKNSGGATGSSTSAPYRGSCPSAMSQACQHSKQYHKCACSDPASPGAPSAVHRPHSSQMRLMAWDIGRRSAANPMPV
mmetsp:Transcript_52256/g.144709  ORF Transcript_52256/g.144709 Transcript_52256/m.144709 type:complete len:221 (-) Transcript_52256:126-788(-)